MAELATAITLAGLWGRKCSWLPRLPILSIGWAGVGVGRRRTFGDAPLAGRAQKTQALYRVGGAVLQLPGTAQRLLLTQ